MLVLLVDHNNLVPNLLSIEELMHMRHKLQQLIEAVPEWHDDGDLVRPPGRVIPRRGCGMFEWRGRLFARKQSVLSQRLMPVGAAAVLLRVREDSK